MPRDTGITDECYYFEDGSPWWASPDIMITGPDTTGKATRPATGSTLNTIRVNVRRKGAAGDPPCYDPLSSGTSDYLQVDLYVCNPTGSPLGPTSPNVKQILHFDTLTSTPRPIQLGAGGTPFLGPPPAAGASSPVNVGWKLPQNPATPHAAEAPDHKCLIARVYTVPGDSPSSGTFQVVDDQHYAQRNICINFCSSPCGVDMVMFNEAPDQPRLLQLRVVEDLKPNPALQQVIGHALQQAKIENYRLAEKSPARDFGLTIKDMPDARFVKDQPPDLSPVPSEDGCLALLQRFLGRSVDARQAGSRLSRIKQQQQQVLPIANLTPSYESRIKLEASQAVNYTLMTDLDGETPGTVHVFHVMEIEDGIVQGGVTLLMVKQ